MKIVVTGTRGIPEVMGGVETHCQELFPRIAAMGVDVTVVRRSAYVNDGLVEWKGVHLHDIPSPKKKAFEAIVHTFKAVRYAKRVHADIVHIHAIGPAILVPYARLLGLKVVFTHHGPDYDRDKWGFFAKAMLRFGERMGCRYANHVIVISDVIRTLVEDKYNRTENVHLVPNGVPKAEICDYPEYFDELAIEPGRYVLGMCRFVPEKRLDDLVNAFPGIEGYKLVLAGDTDFEDDYSRSLKSDAKAAGAVLTGFVRGRRLHSLLSNAACFVLPSSHEGLPIALLEAMSYGLPAVVSDIPANLEVGLPDACYFHCGDVTELSSRIKSALSKGKEAVKYDMSKYDWDHIAQELKKIYEL